MWRFLRTVSLLLIASGTAFPTGVGAAPALKYVVRDEIRLEEVAVRLYGDARLWGRIARWNHLRRPFYIHPGQSLVLRKPSTLDARQGDLAVLNYWRERLGLPAGSAVSAAAAPELTAAPAAPTAPEDLAEGQRLFKAGQYPEALARFESSRARDPGLLPAWFYEIRTLRLLKRESEASGRSEELLKLKPELRALPMFRKTEGQ